MEPSSPADPAPVAEASSLPGTSASDHSLPDELPPVQPPSAGFILQLFVVPALIVGAVILVWLLFGKISSGDQDWRNLVTEVQSGNEYRRWRGATELAQLLRADIELKENGQRLAQNPLIAKELAALLSEQLQASTNDDEVATQQAFLARTLGWLDSVEEVTPVLINAMQPDRPAILRLDAMRSIAIISDRVAQQKRTIDWTTATSAVLEASSDSDPLIRQVAAFTLGMLPGEAIDQRLKVLAEDGDENTRINAALAMCRRQSTGGVPVLFAVLKDGLTAADPNAMTGTSQEEKVSQARAANIMKLTAVKNAVVALRNIKSILNDEQRQQAIELCRPIQESCPDIKVRIEAQTTIRELSATAASGS